MDQFPGYFIATLSQLSNKKGRGNFSFAATSFTQLSGASQVWYQTNNSTSELLPRERVHQYWEQHAIHGTGCFRLPEKLKTPSGCVCIFAV